MILAAGGVVWRETVDSRIEVAIIHRPQYDDWSFPKGKKEESEALITCAFREIVEETGLQVELGPFLGDIEYESTAGEKKVSFWAAKAVGDTTKFTPNSEVDLIEWHEFENLTEKLTLNSDKEILDIFIESPFKANKLIMLRHAKALARSEWQGEDEDRPLDNSGQLQAVKIYSVFKVFGIKEIHTSDAVRCFDTVKNLANSMELKLIISNKLSEYVFKKNKEKSLDYAKDITESLRTSGLTTLLCSHNPVLPRMLEKICKSSEIDFPERKLQPGEAWVLYLGKKKCLQIDVISAPAL